jgi:YegS/Rv2252/BmrU family lipid kinase
LATKYFVIINPNAGKSAGLTEWVQIKSLLEKNNIEFEFHLTDCCGNAEAVVGEKIAQNFRTFIVVGGDGTLNEVINGIFKQSVVPTKEITIGLFSSGTGNDWARYYNLSQDCYQGIERILKPKIITQDVGKVVSCLGGQEYHNYFLNVAGIGLDSKIVFSVNSMKRRGKRTNFAYFVALIKCFLQYKTQPIRINIDDKEISDNFLSMSIGNGKYSGGGMRQTPDANNNDGLLNVAIYPRMTKFTLMCNMPRLYNGKIKKLRGLQYFVVQNLSIILERSSIFEIDGEIIEGEQFDISVLPSSINVMI